jgi:two-component system, NtrC family, sensor kinase
MKQVSRRKLRRNWLSFLQSRYLVRLSLLIFSVATILATLFIFWNTRSITNNFLTNINDQQFHLARQINRQLSDNLDEIHSEIMNLASVLDFVEPDQQGFILKESLERYKDLGLVQLEVTNIEGSIIKVAAEDNIFPHPVINPDSLKDVTKSSHVLPSSDDTHIIVICMPQLLGHPEFRTISAIVDSRKLIKLHLSDLSGDSTFFSIAYNTQKSILYHSNEELIGKKIEDILTDSPSETEDLCFSDDIISDPEMFGSNKKQIYVKVPLFSQSDHIDNFGTLIISAQKRLVLRNIRGIYTRWYLIEGFFILILFIFGLTFASQQQKMSKNLKGIVGEQDQIISSILQNSIDAVIVIDDENNIQMWNRGAQLMFGYPPEAVIGHPLSILLPKEIDAVDEIKRMNDEVEQKGYLKDYITQRLTRDEQKITVNISRTPFTATEGGYVGSTEIIKDVTEKLEFDKRMYNTEKLASLGLMASGIAHEINNPLSIILGFTDLLKEKFDSSSPEMEDLNLIEENANQARIIVKNLLGFSRSQIDTSEISTNAASNIYAVVELIEKTKISKNVSIDVIIEKELPSVRGNKNELQQVLLNLINNSIAAVDPESGMIIIRAFIRSNKWVIIKIEDNGSGISEEDKQRIFDPFFTTKEVGYGTGLGLSLCYGIVSKWGGKITLAKTSTINSKKSTRGTTFNIQLPILNDDQEVKV